MDAKVLGIHHITTIVGDPQQNVDFYAGIHGCGATPVIDCDYFFPSISESPETSFLKLLPSRPGLVC